MVTIWPRISEPEMVDVATSRVTACSVLVVTVTYRERPPSSVFTCQPRRMFPTEPGGATEISGQQILGPGRRHTL